MPGFHNPACRVCKPGAPCFVQKMQDAEDAYLDEAADEMDRAQAQVWDARCNRARQYAPDPGPNRGATGFWLDGWLDPARTT